MRERIDPPPSPSHSSRTGIARLTALLDDPGNEKQPLRKTGTADISKTKKGNEVYPILERKESLAKPRVAGEMLSKSASSESYESSVYEEVSFHNALERSESHDEVTAENDCYEDLTISTDSAPDEPSTHDKAIQQYKEQLGGRPESCETHERQEDASKDDLLQFEKDMAGLDLKISMATDSDNSEEDLEMQPPYDPESYQKLVGPIDPSQKINWKKSVYFLPCLIVLIVFIIVTPVVTKHRREESAAELVESSLQPTNAPPTPPPSRIDSSPSMVLPNLIPQSTFSPTLEASATSPDQCTATAFPTSAGVMELLFLQFSFSIDYCATQPEDLATFQRLNCAGTEFEYRPRGFLPNRFRESDRNT